MTAYRWTEVVFKKNEIMKKNILTVTMLLLIFTGCNNSHKKELQERIRTEVDNEIKAYRDKKTKEAQELKLTRKIHC